MSDLVRVDIDTRQAWVGDRELDLTRREFDLLHILLRNAGRVVGRTELMQEVWLTEWMASTKTVDQHVSTLRRELGDRGGRRRYITTHRGVGFRFNPAMADISEDLAKGRLAAELDIIAARCRDLARFAELAASRARGNQDPRPAAQEGGPAGRVNNVQDQQGARGPGGAALVLDTGRAEASADSARPTPGGDHEHR